MLSAADILSAKDYESRVVAVPEWGGDVRVRSLTGRQRDALEGMFLAKEKGGLANFRATLAAWCCVDEKGDRLFSDADIAKLSEKAAAPLQRIMDVCLEMNAFTDKDVEDLAGNSEAGPSAGSASA